MNDTSKDQGQVVGRGNFAYDPYVLQRALERAATNAKCEKTSSPELAPLTAGELLGSLRAEISKLTEVFQSLATCLLPILRPDMCEGAKPEDKLVEPNSPLNQELSGEVQRIKNLRNEVSHISSLISL